MTLQEAYQCLDYYNIVFFVGMLLQEHFKDFVSTLLCFLMSVIGVPSLDYIQSLGFGYWEAGMFFEAGFFCLSIFLIGTKIGWILFTVTTISFFVNFIGYLVPAGEFYTWYADHYGAINIILFEILVWACIVNSRLKPYLEKLNNLSTDFINKQLEKWNEFNKKRI